MSRACSSGIVALVGSLCMSGCIGVIPIPTAQYTPKEYNTRGEIEKSALAFLKVDDADREDVLIALGEPDHSWNDERYFLYRWITVRGQTLIWAAAGSSGSGDAFAMGKRRHDLVIQFDDDGSVLRYGDIKQWDELPIPGDRSDRFAVPRRYDVRWIDPGIDDDAASASLQFDNEGLRLEQRVQPHHVVRIDPDDLHSFRYASRQDVRWSAMRFRCQLIYDDGTDRAGEARFELALSDLPLLIDYVRECCPKATIKN